MYNHAPEGYACPFCRIVCESTAGEIREIVFQDEVVTAFMSLHDSPNNLGHVLVVPNDHYENIYDLSVSAATRIHECSKAIAFAMKAAYRCDGITMRQHNEPAGGQDVWHYHLHVISRFIGDDPLLSGKVITPEAKRVEFAERLRAHMVNHA